MKYNEENRVCRAEEAPTMLMRKRVIETTPDNSFMFYGAAAIALLLHLAVRRGWIRVRHEGRFIAAVLGGLLLLGLLLGAPSQRR